MVVESGALADLDDEEKCVVVKRIVRRIVRIAHF